MYVCPYVPQSHPKISGPGYVETLKVSRSNGQPQCSSLSSLLLGFPKMSLVRSLLFVLWLAFPITPTAESSTFWVATAASLTSLSEGQRDCPIP